jgi:prevent-host-death family protein
MTRTWSVRDAKTHLGDVVRSAKSEGPQIITVRGREEVVIVSIDEYQRMEAKHTGAELVAVLNHSPFREIEIEPPRVRSRVRPVKL